MTLVNGHKNIVNLIEILEESDPPSICLVLEYCSGGDLFGLLEDV
jgi:serine/threonine protein kinase